MLTNGPHFQGQPRAPGRRRARRSTCRRCARISTRTWWQVYESRVYGRIPSADPRGADRYGRARELEDSSLPAALDVLTEVHDAREVERACGLETQLIGINNRNLKTLGVTDLAVTEGARATGFLLTGS